LTLPHFFGIIDEEEKIKMSLKLALLKSGETIISDLKELISDEKVCGYLFTKPYKVTSQTPILLTEDTNLTTNESVHVSLSPWVLLTSDDQIPVPPDWIVTIVEPIDSLKNLYEENVNGKNSEVSITEG
jgi:hypothetical protein